MGYDARTKNDPSSAGVNRTRAAEITGALEVAPAEPGAMELPPRDVVVELAEVQAAVAIATTIRRQTRPCTTTPTVHDHGHGDKR